MTFIAGKQIANLTQPLSYSLRHAQGLRCSEEEQAVHLVDIQDAEGAAGDGGGQ